MDYLHSPLRGPPKNLGGGFPLVELGGNRDGYMEVIITIFFLSLTQSFGYNILNAHMLKIHKKRENKKSDILKSNEVKIRRQIFLNLSHIKLLFNF